MSQSRDPEALALAIRALVQTEQYGGEWLLAFRHANGKVSYVYNGDHYAMLQADLYDMRQRVLSHREFREKHGRPPNRGEVQHFTEHGTWP